MECGYLGYNMNLATFQETTPEQLAAFLQPGPPSPGMALQ